MNNTPIAQHSAHHLTTSPISNGERANTEVSKVPPFAFTVTLENYPDAMAFFKDAANWNKVNYTLKSDDMGIDDFGGGVNMYDTLTFDFTPDQPNGTFSSDYLKKIESAKSMFLGRLSSAGIRNYAPEV